MERRVEEAASTTLWAATWPPLQARVTSLKARSALTVEKVGPRLLS